MPFCHILSLDGCAACVLRGMCCWLSYLVIVPYVHFVTFPGTFRGVSPPPPGLGQRLYMLHIVLFV